MIYSLGVTLADTLDDLISSRRIEPQLAMKIMTNFDQAIAQVLGEKVKSRMSFKVIQSCIECSLVPNSPCQRDILIHTAFVMRSGRSSSRILNSSWTIHKPSKQKRSRLLAASLKTRHRTPLSRHRRIHPNRKRNRVSGKEHSPCRRDQKQPKSNQTALRSPRK